MWDSLKIIFEKLKITEIVGVCFISLVLILFLPIQLLDRIGILELITKKRSILGIFFILLLSYYSYHILKFIYKFIEKQINRVDKKSIKYMKNDMPKDEFEFLIRYFFDFESHRFKNTAEIDITYGAVKPLVSFGIIYRATNTSYSSKFAHNLQIYINKYLNDSLINGKLMISEEENILKWEWKV